MTIFLFWAIVAVNEGVVLFTGVRSNGMHFVHLVFIIVIFVVKIYSYLLDGHSFDRLARVDKLKQMECLGRRQLDW